MKELEETKTDFEELIQLVSFNIDQEEFGVDILKVREINKMMQITKVPNSPAYVEGIINLRGKVIPVINLRTKLELSKKEYDKNTRIVVIEVNNMTIGFIVDSVSEVLRIPANITEATPEIINGMNTDFIKSVAKLENRILILIDLEKLIADSISGIVKEANKN